MSDTVRKYFRVRIGVSGNACMTCERVDDVAISTLVLFRTVDVQQNKPWSPDTAAPTANNIHFENKTPAQHRSSGKLGFLR